MINPEIIKERLKEINENMPLLHELKRIPRAEFIKNIKSCRIAERCLQINIQCILDICHHIIAENNWPRPQTNYDAVSTLCAKKIIPPSLEKKILPMIGLRNILVHEYIKITPSRIYTYLRHINDFQKFQNHILTYLKLYS